MTGSSLSPRPPPEPPILASQGSVSDLAGIAVGEGSFTGFGAPLSAPCSPLPAFAGTCCAEWIPACAGMTALCGGFRYPLLAPRFRGHVVRMDDETDESVPRSPLSRACPSQAQTPRDDGERAEGGKRAGARLYAHSEIDHPALFEMLADHGSNFLMTYDAAPEIVRLVKRYGFNAVRLSMKNTHHDRLPELVITSEPLFA